MGRCDAHDDGLDGYRSLALSSLSLAEVLGEEANTKKAARLSDCAARLLLQTAASNSDPLLRQLARHAAGSAKLALGDHDAARRQHQLALQELPRQGASSNNGGRSTALQVCGGQVSTWCSHGLLHLALVEFASGDETSGRSLLEQLFDGVNGAARDVSAWAQRFAELHAAWPGGALLSAAIRTRVEMQAAASTAPEGEL